MSKNYANEHPRNKKSNQDSNVKVARSPSAAELNKFIKDRYTDYKKDMKSQGKKGMSFNEFKKPYLEIDIQNIQVFGTKK